MQSTTAGSACEELRNERGPVDLQLGRGRPPCRSPFPGLQERGRQRGHRSAGNCFKAIRQKGKQKNGGSIGRRVKNWFLFIHTFSKGLSQRVCVQTGKTMVVQEIEKSGGKCSRR